MSANANRRIVLATWNAIDNDRHGSALATYFSEDYVRHSGEDDYSRDEFAEVLKSLYAGFPDLITTTEDLVAEGDRVAYRWVSVGTHLGPYLGVPPTYRRVKASGITLSRLEAGVIVEDWTSWDKASVLHQLGIIPIS
jgi:steroid delta-isomerase-like uncharacterized protein